MIVVILILLVSLTSCISNDNGNNLPYNLPNEVGIWVSVSDTTYNSFYYLIGDSIYAGQFTLTYKSSPRDFFLYIRDNPGDLLTFVEPLTDVDVASFEVNINRDLSPYARDKKSVYYLAVYYLDGGVDFIDGEDWGAEIYSGNMSIKGADPLTFQYIGNDYAIDKEHMYHKGKCIPWDENIIKKPSGKTK